MNHDSYGTLTGCAVGVLLRDAVRRAIDVIRSEQLSFTTETKRGFRGYMNDVCTSADRKAQAVYLEMAVTCLPRLGIIAEEEVEVAGQRSQGPFRSYLTIDPLDGTKAYIRRQSHGVGTMVALVKDGMVAAAYVGDVSTGEIYGYHPGSHAVQRIGSAGEESLDLSDGELAHKCFVLLRAPKCAYPDHLERALEPFRSYEIGSGSIGITMARLWKGEVAAVALEPDIETPWDSTPVIGISQKLGCVFLKPGDRDTWTEYSPALEQFSYERAHATIVTPRCYAHHFTGQQ